MTDQIEGNGSTPHVDLTAFDQPEYRVEGSLKVTGSAPYSADISLPGMLWAAFLGSPHPHARIVSVDASAARAAPGVHAVLSGKDIGPRLYGRALFDMPVIAFDTVRFVGERVAAVAAETREQADAAVGLIEVEYEELPALLDHQAALAPGAPVLHPDRATYHSLFPPADVPNPNLQGYSLVKRGQPDLEAVFASAHRVVEDTYTAPRQHQGYIEPHACVVAVEPDGMVRVFAANKNPFRFREQMAIVTGVPAEKIVVDSRFVGGDFGGKGHSMAELPCFYLSQATGRPVKAVMSYADELQAGNPRHDTVCTLRSGVTAEGKIVAHQWRMIYNGGAYVAPKPSIWPSPTWSALEVYAIPNVRQEQLVVYTNTVPAGHVRAPGAVQMALAGEGHLDHIAHELGLDPLELRLRNVVRQGDVSPAGERYREPRAVELLEALKRKAGWDEPLPPDRGRGVALRARHVGQGKTNLVLRLLPDGDIEALYGTPDQGSGSQTVLRRVAAAVLSVKPERIQVRYGDTGEAPPDAGAGASRVTHIVGQAAIQGATALKQSLEEMAAEVMGWPAGQVHIQDDQFVSGSEAAPFDEVARRIASGGTIEARGSYDSAAHHHDEEGGDFNFCAYAVEVHVDRETGRVRVTRAVLAYDVGQIINPIGHQGQLDGSFVYGLGNTLMEEMLVEDGRITTLNLGEYKLPTQMDVVPLETVLVPTKVGPGPFGAKAAGEAVNSAVGPAIANAVYDAVGVRITTLPITAERVYAALQAREGH